MYAQQGASPSNATTLVTVEVATEVCPRGLSASSFVIYKITWHTILERSELNKIALLTYHGNGIRVLLLQVLKNHVDHLQTKWEYIRTKGQ